MNVRRDVTKWRLAALLVALAIGRAEAAQPKLDSDDAPPRDVLELAMFEEGRASRVVLLVEIDGRTLHDVWDEAFRSLFAFYDRDGSATLSRGEAAHLPSAVRVRQLSWGYFFAAGDEPIAWEELCGERQTSEIDLAQLVAYYQARGIGAPALTADREPEPNPVSEALWKTLDVNGDGRVTENDFAAADAAFASLDLNQDEVVSADELAPGIPYPAAQGGALLSPAAASSLPAERLFPLLPLPAWRKLPPELEITACLDVEHPEKSELRWRRSGGAIEAAPHGQLARIEVGGATLSVRLNGAERVAELRAACKLARQRFLDGDEDGDGRLTRAEATKLLYSPLTTQFDLVDLDQDGQIERADWNAWLELKQRLLAGQAIAAAIDHHRGLLELLDLNADGRLSRRERQTAWARLESAGCVVDGAIAPQRLPRQIAVRIGIGKQAWTAPTAPPSEPAWFWGMDRNQDGDVSRDEFLGLPGAFLHIDVDGDGLLSLEEADADERRIAPGP